VAALETASSPVYPAASLQTQARWQYNRWLNRWRVEPAPGRAEAEPESAPDAAAETVTSVPFDDSDRALVERVRGGDIRAFEMLHRRYHARIYRLAFLRIGNADDAADIASQTFCNALKRIESYQFRRSDSIYPWLHQIASNLVIDLVRDRPAGGMLSLDAQAAEDVDSFLEYLPADGPSAQDLVERSEVQELVRQAINKLPADQARAIALRFLGDLSIREIAQSLDRSEGAVKSLLHRALQGMRQHLKTTVAATRGGEVAAPLHPQHREERTESHATEVIHLRPGDS
jgi:RNA polymerase sigma-70 factor, ECF subfamily